MNYQSVAIITESESGEYTSFQLIPDYKTEEQIKAAIKKQESKKNEKVKLFTDPEIIKFAKYTRELKIAVENQKPESIIEKLESIRCDIQNALTELDDFINDLNE